jgi:hypothetical protein
MREDQITAAAPPPSEVAFPSGAEEPVLSGACPEPVEAVEGPGPMKPGRYIQIRREAAGLSVEDVESMASMWRGPGADVVATATDLRKLEADEITDLDTVEDVLIELAVSSFHFDSNVYWALVGAAQDPSQPVPPICRRCGCTWHDACQTDFGGCAWAQTAAGEPPLCTACEDAAASEPPLRADEGPTSGQRRAATGAAVAAGVLAFAMVPGHWLLAASGAAS